MLGHGGWYIRPLDLNEHLLGWSFQADLFPYPLTESFFVSESEISLDFSGPVTFRSFASLLSPLGCKWTLLSSALWSIFGVSRASRRHFGRFYK